MYAVHGEIDATAPGASSMLSTQLSAPLSSQLGGTGTIDWSATTAYFPSTLRKIIDLAVQQCQADPNPAWPQYLLKLVNRQDLCGECIITNNIVFMCPVDYLL